MNLFNCFQAMAFYSSLPLLISYLHEKSHTGFMWVAIVAWFIGFILVSLAIHDSDYLKK